MYIRDIAGNLVNLNDKDIEINEAYSFEHYEHKVEAVGTAGGFWQSENVIAQNRYTLHFGTLAECRDFVGMLASKLGPIIDILGSSTPRAQEPKPQPSKVNDLPF